MIDRGIVLRAIGIHDSDGHRIGIRFGATRSRVPIVIADHGKNCHTGCTTR